MNAVLKRFLLMMLVLALAALPGLGFAQDDNQRELRWEDYGFSMTYPAAWGTVIEAGEDTYGIAPTPDPSDEDFFVTVVALGRDDSLEGVENIAQRVETLIRLFFQSEFAAGLGRVEAVTVQDASFGVLGIPTLSSERNTRAAFMFGEQLFIMILNDPQGSVDDATFSQVLESVQFGAANDSPDEAAFAPNRIYSDDIPAQGAATYPFRLEESQYVAAGLFMPGRVEAISLDLLDLEANVLASAELDSSGVLVLPNTALEAGAYQLRLSNSSDAPEAVELLLVTSTEAIDLVSTFELDVVTTPLDGIDTIPLAPPAEVTGLIDEANPSSFYSFEAEAGQFISAQMIAEDDFELDAALILFTAAGEEVAYNDDEPITFNAAIANIPAPSTGTYVLQAFNTSGSGAYSLRVQVTTEPNPAAPFANATYGGRLTPADPTSGMISPQSPMQIWQVELVAGQTLDVTMVADNGDVLDCYLLLFDPDLRYIDLNDDADAADLPGEFDARLAGITVASDGLYTIVATSFEMSSFGSYQIRATVQ